MRGRHGHRIHRSASRGQRCGYSGLPMQRLRARNAADSLGDASSDRGREFAALSLICTRPRGSSTRSYEAAPDIASLIRATNYPLVTTGLDPVVHTEFRLASGENISERCPPFSYPGSQHGFPGRSPAMTIEFLPRNDDLVFSAAFACPDTGAAICRALPLGDDAKLRSA